MFEALEDPENGETFIVQQLIRAGNQGLFLPLSVGLENLEPLRGLAGCDERMQRVWALKEMRVSTQRKVPV
jgi:hypothetical protein